VAANNVSCVGIARPDTRRGNRRLRRSSGANTAAPRKDRISITVPCTVRELSEAAGVPANEILRILMQEGVMTTITALIDAELTEFVAEELGIDIEFRQTQTLEDQLIESIREQEDAPEDLVDRPPVITFLGHVDHGKTSLLDSIIGIDVVSGESGGITQHIRAYTIEKDGRRISFVDTPGHEAFTEMRARGAHVTDIAVLVVAADDGVMPQTEEAISHAKAAEVPIIVALNKIDLPGVDENKAMQGLTANDLVPSEWGGDVEVVKTSATTGIGIDELIDTVFTVAELHEFKANPNRPALGTCLEAQQEAGRGVVAKVIVQNGTLRVGDVIACGQAYGRVKAMQDTLIANLYHDEAGPSFPVNITGLDVAPAAGEHFYVLDDIAKARSIAETRFTQERAASLSDDGFQHVTLENLFDRLDGAVDVQTLNLILRADVRGSIEAIRKEFEKLDHPEVRIKILQASVGGVTEADITLADASDAIIIGFNVVPDDGARQMADRRGVQVRRYEVIYKITEDLKQALEGLLRPEQREVELGRALVQQTYKISRLGTIAGCRVLSGVIERNCGCRVIRDNTVIGDYPIDTLRRGKDDAKEVREGFECGIRLAGFNDVKEGDVLEVYKVESVDRSFDD
jgi:translation initiation factor IF-2